MRPPGYEPGELPTAPLRVFSGVSGISFVMWESGCKDIHKSGIFQMFRHVFFIENIKSVKSGCVVSRKAYICAIISA